MQHFPRSDPRPGPALVSMRQLRERSESSLVRMSMLQHRSDLLKPCRCCAGRRKRCSACSTCPSGEVAGSLEDTIRESTKPLHNFGSEEVLFQAIKVVDFARWVRSRANGVMGAAVAFADMLASLQTCGSSNLGAAALPQLVPVAHEMWSSSWSLSRSLKPTKEA